MMFNGKTSPLLPTKVLVDLPLTTLAIINGFMDSPHGRRGRFAGSVWVTRYGIEPFPLALPRHLARDPESLAADRWCCGSNRLGGTFVDSTIVRAHQQAAGAKNWNWTTIAQCRADAARGTGRSKGGFSTKFIQAEGMGKPMRSWRRDNAAISKIRHQYCAEGQAYWTKTSNVLVTWVIKAMTQTILPYRCAVSTPHQSSPSARMLNANPASIVDCTESATALNGWSIGSTVPSVATRYENEPRIIWRCWWLRRFSSGWNSCSLRYIQTLQIRPGWHRKFLNTEPSPICEMKLPFNNELR